MFTFASAGKMRWAAVAAVLVALVGLGAWAQDDPPDQAGRVSAISGRVSIQPSGSDDWGQAYQNLPIGPGDRVYTDQDGWVEIQVGQTYVRVGPNTDLTLVNDNEGAIAFGLAQGSVHVRSFGLWPGQSLDLSTPNGDARISQAGEIRADTYSDQGMTVFASLGSTVVVTGAGGFWQQLNPGQTLQMAGTNPVDAQWLQPAGADQLEQWSQDRDQTIQSANSFRYVSPDVPGAADLDAYGDWQAESDYGPIWYPRGVAVDWQPYHYGHWINRDPWGWVWVEDEPWGYAPFHYGRWVFFRNRWGWVPGPREVRPVWSPALVVFAGGGGVGISAWFPLGPGEPYRPWYRCSPRYIDRVNITNIRQTRVVRVQTTYVNVNVTNVRYVNRTIGVTAMRQDDFAAGRSARRSAVQVDRRQFDRVNMVDQPAPVTRQSFVARPVAQPVPVRNTKPTFINQQGMQITNRPGAAPVAPPVRPMQPVRTAPGRVVATPPANSRFQQNDYRRRDQQGGYDQQPDRPVVGRPVPPQNNRGNTPVQAPVQNQNPPSGGQQDRPVMGRPVPPQGNRGELPMQQAPVQNPPANNNGQPQGQTNQPSGTGDRQQYRQDFGQVKADRHDEVKQANPNQNPNQGNQPPQGRPAPTQPANPPQAQPQNKPAPPQANQPQQNRQQFGQQQQRPNDQSNQRNDNKNDNRNASKPDKKPDNKPNNDHKDKKEDKKNRD